MVMNVQTQGNLAEKKVYLPLEEGTYTVKLTKSTEKPTKAGNGAYIDATFEVVEGPSAGRLIFQKFLIDHPSAKAVEIGKDQLSKFLKAVGIREGLEGVDGDVNRINEFTNLLVNAKVKIEKNEQYGDRNKITNFSMR